MNMKTSFIAAAVALATVYSFSVSAVQKDITVTANIDSTLELLQADGSSLPSTMKLDFMPGIVKVIVVVIVMLLMPAGDATQ